MRNRELHDNLRDFALEAAALLEEELRMGAEIEFEVDEQPAGSKTVLYRYTPLTSKFIDARWDTLRTLPSCAAAAQSLGSGAALYLRLQGVPGVDAEPALRELIDRLYMDATSFEFPEERFEKVYGDVELTLYEDSVHAMVVAPLPGLELEHGRVDLGEGMSLIGGQAIDAPPEAVWSDPRERDGQPYVLVVLQRDIRTDMPLPVTEARIRFRRLLTALRLFKSGAVALGPLAWSRAGAGAWQPAQLGSAGQLRGEPWVLTGAEEPELRELMDLLAGARHGGAVAWGLARFEMGCERQLDTEALSDYLLALRALLDGSDDTGRASLALRLAALCAEESDRRALQRRVELAFALERFVIGGGSGDAYMETIGSESPRELVLEVEDQLRALLRDVLCGFLEPDLKSAADDILLRSAEPFEVEVRDTRRFTKRAQGIGDRAQEPEPEPGPAPPSEEATGHAPQAEPAKRYWSTAVAEPEPAPPPAPVEPEEDFSDGVTHSDDWGLDDDPESYSAPV
ncbi:MAG TPA: hypothetical protein VH817_04595 [Thermoleophilaceae bacterium]|jgi:hypothetical protein